MTICIIPARGGSRRIPGKNIKSFHGKPIICYSIEAALNSGLFDRVIVSTDSPEIERIAASAGAGVWRRGMYYGGDHVGTQEVVKECLDGLCIPVGEMVCCLYATAPMVNIEDLAIGCAMAFDSNGSYSMSVGYPPLQDAGQFYWGRAREFREGYPLINNRTRVVAVDPRRVCDINTLKDWNRALKMYEALQND